MAVRRWIGGAGIVVAIAGGTVATARATADDRFEAQMAVHMPPPPPRGLPVPVHVAAERVLRSPAVMDAVRVRLGETPPVWVTPGADDTVLVRSRGASRGQAAEVTETYAVSYVELQRRRVEVEAMAASESLRRKTDEIRSQLESAEEPQRTSLVQLLGVLNERLDQLQLDLFGPSLGALTPAEPVDDGSGPAWLVAALGVSVGAGAAVSARRTGRRHRAVM